VSLFILRVNNHLGILGNVAKSLDATGKRRVQVDFYLEDAIGECPHGRHR